MIRQLLVSTMAAGVLMPPFTWNTGSGTKMRSLAGRSVSAPPSSAYQRPTAKA